MINLGFGAFEQWGAEVRRRFPNAILALNPPTSGSVGAAEAAAMVKQAQRLGGPVTFVVRHDLLTDEAIRTFKGHGPISVWGHTGDVQRDDRRAEAAWGGRGDRRRREPRALLRAS